MSQNDVISQDVSSNDIVPQKSKKSLWWVWLILAVVILAAIGVGAYLIYRSRTHTPSSVIPYPPIPSVPGSPQTPAPPPTPGAPPPIPSNPPPPPGTPCPQYYSIPNVNFGGGDVPKTQSPYTVDSEQNCQAVCTGNPDCMFYNYEANKSNKGGKCWIKNVDATPGYQLGFNVPNQPGYACPEFMYFSGAKLSANPVGNPSSSSGNSIGQCQTNCDATGCHFYTFEGDGTCSTYQFNSLPGTNTGVNLGFSSPSIPAGTPVWS